MEHTEFERLAPILRAKAKQIGLSFFEEEEAAKERYKNGSRSSWGAAIVCVSKSFVIFVIL